MRSILIGIILAGVFGIGFFLTRQGEAGNVAFDMASRAVHTARISGQWNNVQLSRDSGAIQDGIWKFRAVVHDNGARREFWIPVHQTCWGMKADCFHVGAPEPARATRVSH